MNSKLSNLSAKVTPMTRYKLDQLITLYQQSSSKKVSQRDVLEIAIASLYEQAYASESIESFPENSGKEKQT
ncbi:hypothetical protein [Alkalicoccus saliphilus]|uniref:Uncharacterized protein n=1 Tax=Alkalicoccus saliphilus TaxID=200989 RepID=A0A2T4U3X0_9BACI|nr:hypothetical protein [Alkalicoccus saliphilus]PTL38098.1 hypothetical protein C6Y45_12950 [Alkalicoccus saliphilus]